MGRSARYFLLPLILYVTFSHPTYAITKNETTAINSALKQVKNLPSGKNLLEVFEICGVRVNYKASFFDTIDFNKSESDLKKGDKVLDILFTLQTPLWDPNRPEIYKDLAAQWVFRDNKIIPESGWARNFQYNVKPISWQDCP